MKILSPAALPQQAAPAVDQSGRLVPDWFKAMSSLREKLAAVVTMFGTGSTTVAALPSAATVGAGARAFVTDATATTFHSTVAGSGANKVPVVSDGTNWLIG